MPTPRRETLVQAVKTRFQGITTGAGYNTDIGTYADLWISKLNVPDGQTLALSIEDEEEVQRQVKSGVHECALTIKLGFFAVSSTPDTTARAIIADVTNAIKVDRTWGGYAIDTEPGKNAFVVVHEDKLQVFGEYVFTINYRTTSFNPYATQ